MDAQEFITKVKHILQEDYGLRPDTAELLIRKYSLNGFLTSCGDKYPLSPEETADTMIRGLVSFYSKQEQRERQED